MSGRQILLVVLGSAIVIGAILVAVLVGTDQPSPEVADSPVATTPATTPAPEQPPTGTTPPPSPTTAPPSPSPTATEVELTTADVVTGLEAPWDVAFAPDGRTFVTERDSGRVLELTGDGQVEEVHRFDVDASGEAGLLGLAVSPAYDRDGLLYAYYTAGDGNRVVRFTPGGEEEAVLTGIPKAPIHDGGRIAFGPDGKLYVGTGDAGVGERAQDPGSLGGKILRLEPDGSLPADNPDPSSPVWTLGHRNVQGFAWDAEGRLYASEFGPDRDDEINLIEAGGNYGWPQVTGEAGVEGLVDPLVVRQPPEASWSGLGILRDGAIPQWEGDLFAASLRGRALWRIQIGGDGRITDLAPLLEGEFGRLRHAVEAPDGSLWLLTSNLDGRGDPRAGDDRIVRLGPPG